MASSHKHPHKKNESGKGSGFAGRITGLDPTSKLSFRTGSQIDDLAHHMERTNTGGQDNYGAYNQNRNSSNQDNSSSRNSMENNDDNVNRSASRRNDYGSHGSGNWPTIPHTQTFSGDQGNETGIYGNQMGYGFSREGGYDPDREDIGSRSDMQISWGGDQRNSGRGMRVRSQDRNDQYGYEQSRGGSMRTQSGDYGSEGRFGNSNYGNMNDYDNYGSRTEQDYTHGSFRPHRDGDYRQNDSQGGASNREGLSRYGNENYNSSQRGGWGNQGGDFGSQSGNRFGNYGRSQGEYGSQRGGNYGGQYDEQRGFRNESYGNRSQGEYGWQQNENYEDQFGAQGSSLNDRYRAQQSYGGYGSQGGQGGYSRGRSNQGGYGNQGGWQSRGGSYNEEMGSRRGSQRDSSYGDFDEDEYGSPNARRRNENEDY